LSNPTDALIAQLVALDNGIDALGHLAKVLEAGPVQAAIECQVLQLRAQVTASLALIPDSEADDEKCQHPLEARIDFGGMGRTAWTCRDCGFEFDDSKRQET